MFCTASGSRPPMAVAEVSRIGRKRISPARSMASSSGTPCSRSWLVKSTSRIEFLISMPMSAMKPMLAVKEMLLPVKSSISEAAEHAERHHREHDERRFEVAELEHEDREDAEDGDDDRRADAAEGFFARLRFAAQRVVIAARPAMAFSRLHDIRRHLRGVEAALDFGVDGRPRARGCSAESASAPSRSAAWRAARSAASRRRAWGRAPAPSASRSARAPTGVRTMMSYCSPLAILERARRHAGDGQAHRAVELHRRHAEQARLLRIHRELQVRARHLQRVRARRACRACRRRASRPARASFSITSRSRPMTRTAIGALIGGPFTNSFT